LDEEDLEFVDMNIKEMKLFAWNSSTEDFIFINGKKPKIYNLKTKESFEFFIDEGINKYSIIIKETCDSNSFFLFVKELYLIFLVKEKSENSLAKHKYLVENISDKKLPVEQLSYYEFVLNNLNENLILVDIYSVNNNNFGEIISVQLNSIKSLILINSTDRILRLFKYDYDAITLYQDYFDSVNRKKWLNAYFYTLKVKNNIQDLIVSALSDVNSLEFILIDIETGNFIKRLEPFKYQCSNFICHYINHFTLVLISNKKLFNIIGYFLNNWGAFAPKLKYIEENIEFIEEESFFDDFNKKLKNPPVKIFDPNSIKNIFKTSNNSNNNLEKSANLFFKYSPIEDDSITIQSEKELNDTFQYFNEIVEIIKK
jgi:hypothetical protein